MPPEPGDAPGGRSARSSEDVEAENDVGRDDLKQPRTSGCAGLRFQYRHRGRRSGELQEAPAIDPPPSCNREIGSAAPRVVSDRRPSLFHRTAAVVPVDRD
jgi:hypothetical protein